MYITGTIKPSEIEVFKEICKKIRWEIVMIGTARIVYIDGEGIPHVLGIGPETSYRIIDCD